MATNRDLLKEAIADAKAVKETAIANAKAALEEAFTPYLKEKLSAKLAEMEEFELKENDLSEVEKEMEEMKKKEDMMDEEISLDELLAELDEETVAEEDTNLYEAKDEEEMSIEDMSEDDLKSFIEDVIKDMVSAGELEAGHEGMEDEKGEDSEMEAGEEMDDEEEINIDELLAELEVDEAYGKGANGKGSLASAEGNDEYITDTSEEDDAPYSKSKAQSISFEEDLEELTADQVGAGVSGDNEAIQAIANALDKTADWVKKNFNAAELKKALANIGSAAGRAMRKEEIEELQELQAELNEVNLLNAKLLYTNKIFRNKSLTESQKVKVLTAFDKATSKKEVELVYETLLESLKVSTTRTPIKESLGSASRGLGSATSKPIIENDAFSRMRELAFGKKN